MRKPKRRGINSRRKAEAFPSKPVRRPRPEPKPPGKPGRPKGSKRPKPVAAKDLPAIAVQTLELVKELAAWQRELKKEHEQFVQIVSKADRTKIRDAAAELAKAAGLDTWKNVDAIAEAENDRAIEPIRDTLAARLQMSEDQLAQLKEAVLHVAHSLKGMVEAGVKAAESGDATAFKAAAEKINQLVVTLEAAAGKKDHTPKEQLPGTHPPLAGEAGSTASPTAKDASAGANELPPYSPETKAASHAKEDDEDQSDTRHQPSKGRHKK